MWKGGSAKKHRRWWDDKDERSSLSARKKCLFGFTLVFSFSKSFERIHTYNRFLKSGPKKKFMNIFDYKTTKSHDRVPHICSCTGGSLKKSKAHYPRVKLMTKIAFPVDTYIFDIIMVQTCRQVQTKGGGGGATPKYSYWIVSAAHSWYVCKTTGDKLAKP